MPSCLVGLGSNLGDRRGALDTAVDRLGSLAGTTQLVHSRWYETAPIGGPSSQPTFLNGTARLETSCSPEQFLQRLQQIEIDLGRQRTDRWGPRTIDLDLLLFDRHVCQTPTLTLPHPHMAWRRFVLEPAAEIAGEMVHPTLGWTVARLLEHLNTTPRYVALTGGIGAGKTQLAHALAQQIPAQEVCETFDPRQLEQFYADPASHAWQIELEFLRRRAELLTRDHEVWTPSPWVVSDFWFGQSEAFAHVWLPSEQHQAYDRHLKALQKQVVSPRLIVLLDAPTDVLLRRVAQPGRPCEQCLTGKQLDRIRRAVVEKATAPGQGPILRLDARNETAMLREVTDALQATE